MQISVDNLSERRGTGHRSKAHHRNTQIRAHGVSDKHTTQMRRKMKGKLHAFEDLDYGSVVLDVQWCYQKNPKKKPKKKH